MAARRGGTYYLTYHRYSTREQVERCYPKFAEFLRLKKTYGKCLFLIVSGRLEVERCKRSGTFRVCGINFVGENVFGVGARDGKIQHGQRVPSLVSDGDAFLEGRNNPDGDSLACDGLFDVGEF